MGYVRYPKHLARLDRLHVPLPVVAVIPTLLKNPTKQEQKEYQRHAPTSYHTASSPGNLPPQRKRLEPHPFALNPPLNALRLRNARPSPHQRPPVARLGSGAQVAHLADQQALPAGYASREDRVGAQVGDGLLEVLPVRRDEDDVGL